MVERYDIKITEITIEKINGDGFLQIFPNPEDLDEADPIFTNLVFGSSIFFPGMTGVLKIKEVGRIGESFSLSGYEKVTIVLENPKIEDSKKTIQMCVENVRRIGDVASEALGGKNRKADEGWQLELISCESYILNRENWSVEEVDEGLIAPPTFRKIATNEDETWGVPIFKEDETITEEPKGLINEFAEEYFSGSVFITENDADTNIDLSDSTKEMEIEGTKNVIWLRKNNNLYPWGKDVGNQTLLQMINNLTENSVTEDEEGFNYVFYRDIDRWNYKSINKIIKDSEDDEDSIRNYTISDVNIDDEKWEHGDPRILSLIDFRDWDHLGFWEGGAYSAYYEMIKPYYDDPYFNYLDFATSHQDPQFRYTSYGKREIIDWDYHRDHTLSIEQYKLLPDDTNTSVYIPSEDDDSNSLISSRKTHASPLYGYFSSPYNDYRNVPYDYMGSLYSDGKYGKSNDIMWQTMYDITPLKGKIKYTIEKNVKERLKQDYKNYLDKRNLKEKWNVYKHSICCDKPEVNKYQFLAVITDAKLVQDNDRGGIFEYSWKEVEVWPKEAIEEMEGPELVTLIDEEQSPDAPMQVVEVRDGLSGTYREDLPEDPGPDDPTVVEWTNPAFNINELFNSDDADDIFVGPGVNVADEDFNDYPEGYQVMPVGGYFRINDPGPCDFGENAREDRADVYYHNHLVQMYRMPGNILETIKPSPRFEEVENENGETTTQENINIPEEIFFFDVQNAHDGLCGC